MKIIVDHLEGRDPEGIFRIVYRSFNTRFDKLFIAKSLFRTHLKNDVISYRVISLL